MREIELKFLVDAKRAEAVDSSLRRGRSKRTSIESRYYDTDDRCLAAAGLSLRLRRIGRVWEQTLKGSDGGAVDRHEETAPRPGKWGPEGPPIDPMLHAQSAVGSLLHAAMQLDGSADAQLHPVYTSIISRRAVQVEAYGARVEVAHDQGVIRAGDKSAPVCEVEYELKSGDPRALVELGRAGVLEHGLWLSTVSKSARGNRMIRCEDGGLTVKAQAPRLVRTMSGPAILRSVIKACLDHVMENASEVAAGQRDEESIHQLRVGLRRLRTASRELGALSRSLGSAWEGCVREAFRALGEYRDRDTVAKSLHGQLSAAGSPEPMLPTPRAAAPDPVAVVRDERFQCSLLDVLGFTLEPSRANGDAAVAEDKADSDVDRPLHRVRSRLDKLHGELKGNAKDFEQLDEDAQHRVRKRLKRLRYLAELIGPLFKAKKVERYLEKLRPAQDALGMHNDLDVGLRMAREAVDGTDTKAWFNVGWLTARKSASAATCRDALACASEARQFW